MGSIHGWSRSNLTCKPDSCGPKKAQLTLQRPQSLLSNFLFIYYKRKAWFAWNQNVAVASTGVLRYLVSSKFILLSRESDQSAVRARLGVAGLPHQDRGIPLSEFPNGTTSKLAGLSSHCPFNAERQAGKLWIPSSKSLVWPDAESNPSLQLKTQTLYTTWPSELVFGGITSSISTKKNLEMIPSLKRARIRRIQKFSASVFEPDDEHVLDWCIAEILSNSLQIEITCLQIRLRSIVCSIKYDSLNWGYFQSILKLKTQQQYLSKLWCELALFELAATQLYVKWDRLQPWIEPVT